MPRFDWAGCSHVGLVRAGNEDSGFAGPTCSWSRTVSVGRLGAQWPPVRTPTSSGSWSLARNGSGEKKSVALAL